MRVVTGVVTRVRSGEPTLVLCYAMLCAKADAEPGSADALIAALHEARDPSTGEMYLRLKAGRPDWDAEFKQISHQYGREASEPEHLPASCCCCCRRCCRRHRCLLPAEHPIYGRYGREDIGVCFCGAPAIAKALKDACEATAADIKPRTLAGWTPPACIGLSTVRVLGCRRTRTPTRPSSACTRRTSSCGDLGRARGGVRVR